MINKNELIFVNKILSSELTIRRAAKQLGLRRDDLINRIREMLKGDEENLKKLDLIIYTNKLIFDNLEIEDVAKKMNLTEKELDRKIKLLLEKNYDKKKKYEEYKQNVLK